MCGLENMVILTFCYTIFLWSLGIRGLMYQPMLLEVLIELSIHVFTTIVKAKDSEFGRKLGLNHYVRRVEDSKNLIFVF